MNNDPVISDVCGLFPILGSSSRVPSFYMAHIAFFLGFLFTNAYTVYTLPSDNLNSQNLENRKFRALNTMIILVLIYLITSVIRFNVTGCESILGILVATVFFGFLGYGWYLFAEFCGARSADILGISSSFVPSNAETSPLICSQEISNS